MHWRKFGAAIHIVILASLPNAGLAQSSNTSLDANAATTRINQVANAAVGAINSYLYHEQDVRDATKKITETRASAIRVITENVNGFKAQADTYLDRTRSRTNAGDEQARVKTAVYTVEFTAQQAVDKIELAVRKRGNQTSLPSSAQAPFYRAELPTSSLRAVLRPNLQAPTLTNAYAQTGARPFIPLSPNINGALYRTQSLRNTGSNTNLFQAAGLALGGYLGMRHLFNDNVTIRINKFSPHDPQTYVFSLVGEREQYQQVAVPNFLEGALVKRLRAGNYKVYYKPTSELDKPAGMQEFAYYPITMYPGEAWCLQVPRPPTRCY